MAAMIASRAAGALTAGVKSAPLQSSASLCGTPVRLNLALPGVAVSRRCSVRAEAPVETETPLGTSSAAPTPVDEAAAATNAPPRVRVNPSGASTSVFEGGRAQETINGRAAMIGFVAALGAELNTGYSVMQQIFVRGNYPPGLPQLLIPATFIAIILGSFAPRVFDQKDNGLDTPAKPVGPFTPFAETINGRAAMIGFAALLVTEAIKGGALF